MTAAVTRDLVVTYGSTTVGGTTDYLIEGPFRLELDARTGLFECVVSLSKDTEADFRTAEATLVTAFRTDRQRLLIELGSGTTRYDFNPSSTVNTGFDQVPSIEKLKNATATGRSADYAIRIQWLMPGTLVNADGHTEAEIELTLTPGRLKQLRIAGTYTAVSTNTAYAQYVANGDTLAAVWTGIFGGTYNKVMDVATPSDTNKVCRFERLYKEVFANEGSGVLDLAYVIDQQLSITRGQTGPGDSSSSVRRPTELLVAYDASIDRTVATDLENKWNTVIFPHLLEHVRNTAGAGAIAAVDVQPVFGKSENHISASIRCLAFVGSVVELDVEVDDQIDLGVVATPVWDDQPFSRDVDRGPQEHVRTVTVIRLSQGTSRTSGASNPLGQLFGSQGVFDMGSPLGPLFGSQGIFDLPGTSSKGWVPSPEHELEGNFLERTRGRRKKVVHMGVGPKVKLIAEFEQRVFTRAEKPRG